MIRVAYDISVLGQGYVNAKARSGIFRVVESLLLELIKQIEIDVTAVPFNQTAVLWDSISSSLYLQHERQNEKISFSACLTTNPDLSCLYRALVQFQKHLVNFALKNSSFFYKPSLFPQAVFKVISKLFEKTEFNPNYFSVYHSPFYPIPSRQITQGLNRIITVHDLLPILMPYNFTKKQQQNYQAIIKSIDIYRDWVICVSYNTKNDLCNYLNIDPDRVFVTYPGVTQALQPIKDSLHILQILNKYKMSGKPYLLSLCTIEPRKNLDFLLRCFNRLLSQEPSLDVNLVLVGANGWKNKKIFRFLQDNSSLRRRVTFTGYIPDQDLSAIYSGAIGFVYPSLYEGFGLPPLEAMQCGTPVIASNTSSLPEVVGDAGIMIDPRDEDALCQAILDLVSNESLRLSLVDKGLKRSQQFTWKKCAEQTVDVYRIASA